MYMYGVYATAQTEAPVGHIIGMGVQARHPLMGQISLMDT